MTDEQKIANVICAITQSLNYQIELAARAGLKIDISVKEIAHVWVDVEQFDNEVRRTPIRMSINQIDIEVLKAL